MKILVFDNYDSFTYNLVHLAEKILHQEVDVYRNDQIPLEKVKDYDKIILSPGPGIPGEAGLLLPLIKEYAPSKSILGVCLGHEGIGEAFGGKLVNLSAVFHGVATKIRIVKREMPNLPTAPSLELQRSKAGQAGLPTGQAGVTGANNSHFTSRNLFEGIPEEFDAGRYHSWIISDENFPGELEVTARDDNNFIMALQHKRYDVQGVQFHPESVLTPMGEQILRNWLNV